MPESRRLSLRSPRICFSGSLCLVVFIASACSDGNAAGLELDGAVVPGGSYVWELPPGFPEPRVPADNPMSYPKVELGRHLFYDTRLSGNQTQSCASCHRQSLAFTDGRALSVGSTNEVSPRGSMSLVNVAYAATLTWGNPILRALEEQALIPMFGEEPEELALPDQETLLTRLAADATLEFLFADAFPDEPDPISLGNTVAALASFQRSIISARSAFDRYNEGDESALSAEALQGRDLFFSERLECFHCHGGANFSDSFDSAHNAFDAAQFHNNGLYNVDGRGAYPEPNTGVHSITGDQNDMGAFRAPTLRNIALTAPYMHDGSLGSLEAVLDHYAAGGRLLTEGPHVGDGRDNPFKSPFVRGFELTDTEKEALIAFLESLTDEALLTDPRFENPYAP